MKLSENKKKNLKKIVKSGGDNLRDRLNGIGKIVSVIDIVGIVVILSLVSFGYPGRAENETVALTSSAGDSANFVEMSAASHQAVISDTPPALGETAKTPTAIAASTGGQSGSETQSSGTTELSSTQGAVQNTDQTNPGETDGGAGSGGSESTSAASSENVPASGAVSLNPNWTYANMSVINSGQAVMYTASANRKGKIVALNAGHGTNGGESVKTYCHPDGSAKVTGGTTAAGSIQAVAVSSGMTFRDGTPERTVTLRMAQILKEKLLSAGYDVLMLRDGEDVQLDNIARTVIANNMADIHIALHWDGDGLSTTKGAFYMSVPDRLKSMQPVATYWQYHEALGDALINGLRAQGIKIWGSNPLDTDLTQTSYSTIPSVDIELGNQCSDHSDATLITEADGLLAGINSYFGMG